MYMCVFWDANDDASELAMKKQRPQEEEIAPSAII